MSSPSLKAPSSVSLAATRMAGVRVSAQRALDSSQGTMWSPAADSPGICSCTASVGLLSPKKPASSQSWTKDLSTSWAVNCVQSLLHTAVGRGGGLKRGGTQGDCCGLQEENKKPRRARDLRTLPRQRTPSSCTEDRQL